MFGNFKNSFKIFLASSLMLSASFFVQNSPARAGNFYATCTGYNLRFARYLSATCDDANHNPVRTTIDIDRYIANTNGVLTWQNNGDFRSTCDYININVNGEGSHTLKLIARCRDRKQNNQFSNIDLNEKISNQNGILSIDF